MNKEKIRICFFIGSFRAGGAENLLLQILRSLDLERYRPYIAVFRKKGTLLNEYLELHIPIVEFGKSNIISPIMSFVKFILFLRKRKTEVIHINLVGCYVFAIFGGLLAGVKTRIIHWHNVYSPTTTDAWKVYIGSKLASRIVAISKAVKRNNCQIYRIPVSKVALIYNAIDTRSIIAVPQEANINSICIGSVGKLDRQKGFDILLKAFSIVNNVFPDVVLEIVGDGPLKKELEAYAIELGIRDKVRFLGLLNNKTVLDKIGGWSVFVLTSRWEGFGIVLLEAMAMKKPIVATDVEGIPEVVKDGETGFLCSKDDAQEIAERIIWFLKNESEAFEFGKRGRKRLDSLFSLDVAMEKLCVLYEQR